MIGQLFVPIEANITIRLIATVPLLIIVPILVLNLVAFGRKAACAVSTLKWLVTGVRPLMQLQISQVLKLLTTYLVAIHEGAVASGIINILGTLHTLLHQIRIHDTLMHAPMKTVRLIMNILFKIINLSKCCKHTYPFITYNFPFILVYYLGIYYYFYCFIMSKINSIKLNTNKFYTSLNLKITL